MNEIPAASILELRAVGPNAIPTGVCFPSEPIRLAYARVLLDLFTLFGQKHDERGPENVIRAGAEGMLSQLQERLERVKAALVRGQTSPEELRTNALDIAGFGVVLTMILDGTWMSHDGRRPSVRVGSPAQDGLEGRVSSVEERLDALGMAFEALRGKVIELIAGKDGVVVETSPTPRRANPDLAKTIAALEYP